LNFNRQKVLEELRAKQGAYCENTLECTVVHSRPDGFGYVSLPSFRDRRPLFSTLSIYIAKNTACCRSTCRGRFTRRGQAGPLPFFCRSFVALWVSLPSFRNRRPLFSTLSIYIAKKRRLPQVYLSWQGIPTVAGSPAEAGWGPRTQIPKLTRT
jgi:hypothetical protein